jgi:hypothetical protein
MLDTFDVGDAPNFDFSFYDVAGALADPTTLKIVTKNPAGTETPYTFPTTGLAKLSVGVYRFSIPQFTSTQAGQWYIRANATGTLTVSVEDSFIVRSTAYTTPLP